MEAPGARPKARPSVSHGLVLMSKPAGAGRQASRQAALMEMIELSLSVATAPLEALVSHI